VTSTASPLPRATTPRTLIAIPGSSSFMNNQDLPIERTLSSPDPP
jgi:hypothetical protein